MRGRDVLALGSIVFSLVASAALPSQGPIRKPLTKPAIREEVAKAWAAAVQATGTGTREPAPGDRRVTSARAASKRPHAMALNGFRPTGGGAVQVV